MKKVYRILIQEALNWHNGRKSLREALVDIACESSTVLPLLQMEQTWEEADGDFWSDRRLEIVVEENDFVAYFVDETDGRCPHGKDPVTCKDCQDYAESKDKVPFWMENK
jgi:hypothetical protein